MTSSISYIESEINKRAKNYTPDVLRSVLASMLKSHRKGHINCSCGYCVILSKYTSVKVREHHIKKRLREFGGTYNNSVDTTQLKEELTKYLED